MTAGKFPRMDGEVATTLRYAVPIALTATATKSPHTIHTPIATGRFKDISIMAIGATAAAEPAHGIEAVADIQNVIVCIAMKEVCTCIPVKSIVVIATEYAVIAITAIKCVTAGIAVKARISFIIAP